MKKIGLGILAGAVIAVLTVGVASALPSNRGIDKAGGVSPAIEEGTVIAPPEGVPVPFPQLPESELTKIVFIRYAPGIEPVCDNDGICEPRENWKTCSDCKKGGDEEEPTTACYAFLSGAKPKWNGVEDYVYSTTSLEIPSADAVTTWEGPVSGDIFGSGSLGNYPWGVYDYTNSISFGDYPEKGVLAVTAIWFRGKNIYEYDIMFDTNYAWGDALDPTLDPTDPPLFDLPTVTLHELGHGAGMGDLYDVACQDNVMYGYLGLAEVKRTLQSGDITGIQTLYGVSQ